MPDTRAAASRNSTSSPSDEMASSTSTVSNHTDGKEVTANIDPTSQHEVIDGKSPVENDQSLTPALNQEKTGNPLDLLTLQAQMTAMITTLQKITPLSTHSLRTWLTYSPHQSLA
jgi:hypothetical protein